MVDARKTRDESTAILYNTTDADETKGKVDLMPYDNVTYVLKLTISPLISILVLDLVSFKNHPVHRAQTGELTKFFLPAFLHVVYVVTKYFIVLSFTFSTFSIESSYIYTNNN